MRTRIGSLVVVVFVLAAVVWGIAAQNQLGADRGTLGEPSARRLAPRCPASR